MTTVSQMSATLKYLWKPCNVIHILEILSFSSLDELHYGKNLLLALLAPEQL